MLHPDAIHRRITAVTRATGYAGGVLPLSPSPLLRLGCRVEGAGTRLEVARGHMRTAYHPARGRPVASLAWWQRAMQPDLQRARHGIRSAVQILVECEKELQGLTLPAIRSAA
jgi:hypothetical protein